MTVGTDNRAVLSVALDRSDSDYYACDAGCLDSPVLLSQSYTNFPVKLTKPLTSILYITSDYQHMQDLRNVLHVHQVEEGTLQFIIIIIITLPLSLVLLLQLLQLIISVIINIIQF